MARRMQPTVGPDLKIVVMSATLAADPIAAFFGNCPVVAAEGKLFPVEVAYVGTKGTTGGLALPYGKSLLSGAAGYNPLFRDDGIETVKRPADQALTHPTRAL